MRVRARNAAIVAGLLAGAYLVALFTVRRVPDRVVAWLGGPTGIARDGGLALRYRPPAGLDPTRFEQALAARGAASRREADAIAIELPGIGEAEAGEAAAMLGGGLEFREVIEDRSLLERAERGAGRDYFIAGVRVELESWLPDGAAERHVSDYLVADEPSELDAAFDQLLAADWQPPPHSMIAYERLGPEERATRSDPRWRSYFVGDRVLLDGSSVSNAVLAEDPNTGLPIVLVEFDRDGAQRFAEITSRLVGHKLATLVGGVVRSAPYLAGPIRAGRAAIRVGSGPEERRREAAALVAVLRFGALPPGGAIDDHTWIAPADITTTLWLARLLIGLAGGALVGLAFGVVVRVARPSWQPRPRHRAGRVPLQRFAVTLLAPVAVFALHQVSMFGIDQLDLAHTAYRATGSRTLDVSVAALGVGPIIVAFIVVELATLIVPSWRRTRLRPGTRIAMGRYVAVLGVALALLQGHLVYSHVAELALSVDAEALLRPLTHLTVVVSLTAGTMLLVIVAGMIRQHGLGNGYAAVMVSGWGLALLQQALLEPTAGDALGLATLAVIGIATVALLRMRVGDDGESPLRVPSSGVAPLATSRNVVAIWSLVTLGLAGAASAASTGTLHDFHEPWLVLGSTAVLAVLWSFAFSRPAIVAPFAARSPFAPPAQASWRRATLLSLVVLAAIAAAAQLTIDTAPAAQSWCDPPVAMMLAAVLLDALDDLRARRGDLVVAWPLHQPQHAELVRATLARAGIECHLASSHLRALLAWFGPYAPIDVIVPAADATTARGKIAALFDDLAIEAFD